MSEPFLRTRWVISIDGTWSDRNLQDPSTVISDLGDLISTRHHQVHYLEGVGTSSTVDKVLGGLTGLGIHTQVRRAYRFLIQNWNEGDEIVILGYSRGAFAALLLAELISFVGLPQEKPKNSARELYKRFIDGDLDKADARGRSIWEFKCHERVQIKALGMFDTIGTLGIPRTGILHFLNLLPRSNKTLVRPVNWLRKVDHIFHALAAHETRASYYPVLIHLPFNSPTNLEQVWFNGSHHDLGKQRRQGGGLIDIPLAWMIDRLASVGVQFNPERLEERFPGYHRDHTSSNGEDIHYFNEWASGKVHQTYKGPMALMGYHPRAPGQYQQPGTKTNQLAHISVRLRGHGITKGSPTLPGLQYVTSVSDSNESIEWTSRGSWSSDESKGSKPGDKVVVPEAQIGVLEAALQNLSLP